jgi:ornithine decarboxylase
MHRRLPLRNCFEERVVTRTYKSVQELLLDRDPQSPVYCVYPHVYRDSTRRFLDGFPGRVLYAVKANNHPAVLKEIFDAGVRHFDCASLAEIELVSNTCPGSTMYYMNPVRIDGHARRAQLEHGVRHFIVDHHSGLAPLVREIEATKSVIFARMAVSHVSAQANLSAKFGAKPENIPALLAAIADTGAEPALAFNVGTGVTDPEAYVYALDIAHEALSKIPFKVRLLDIGGGFPKSYPGYRVPALEEYFSRTRQAGAVLPLADNGELLAEPGRALSAPGLSAVTRVLLRKAERVYLNDGMYGIFWELRFKGHLRYPCRVFRKGRPLLGEPTAYRLLGPTCDSTDELPGRVELPVNVDVGDHIEFGCIGAYSLSGRTDFNGFYSDDVISIVDESARPPE